MRASFGFVILAGLALAGCGPAGEAPPAGPDEAPTATAADGGSPKSSPAPAPAGPAVAEVSAGAIVSPDSLAGEYRIPGVDGRDIDLPHGISASIDEATIHVSAGCLRFAWTYRFEGARLVTQSTPGAGCQRGLYPEEEAVRAAFDAADTVRRLPSNGIEFSGGGRSVILFSQ